MKYLVVVRYSKIFSHFRLRKTSFLEDQIRLRKKIIRKNHPKMGICNISMVLMVDGSSKTSRTKKDNLICSRHWWHRRQCFTWYVFSNKACFPSHVPTVFWAIITDKCTMMRVCLYNNSFYQVSLSYFLARRAVKSNGKLEIFHKHSHLSLFFDVRLWVWCIEIEG